MHHSALVDAAFRGCLADVVRLLAHGADVNEQITDGSGIEGVTALFIASERGRALDIRRLRFATRFEIE